MKPTAEVMRLEVDDLVSLQTPEDLYAIGFWYEDFEQVPDETVIELLERARREAEGHGFWSSGEK